MVVKDATKVRFINEEAAGISHDYVTFSFGENWKVYLSDLEESTIRHAENSFTTFTKLGDLREHTFLDLGCGSGLNSLIAYRLGAQKIISVDIDPHSIDCVTNLRKRFASGATNWQVVRGSVLDQNFVASLGAYSYVYSYGVLHHTGAMWKALNHAVERVRMAGGILHLGIYNQHKNSRRWLKVKRVCNRFPRTALPAFKASYILLTYAQLLSSFHSPAKYAQEYRTHRGMSVWRDIDDWFGGLPYEYAKPGHVVNFLADRGFVLLRLRDAGSIGCNEFLFRSEQSPDGHG